MAKDVKQNYSSKKIGPIHMAYSGKQHIGNVMEPSIGGSREGAQHYTAISKFWGLKQNHDSKQQALQWLKQQHGEPMQMEANEKLTSTVHQHEYKHTSGMSGSVHHTAWSNGQHEFTSHPNPSHKLVGPRSAIQHSSMAKAHQRMKGLGYKMTGEGGISETVNEDVAPEQDTVGQTPHTIMDKKKEMKFKKLIRKFPGQASKTIDLINGMYRTHESFYNVWKNAKLRNEELFDRDVNQKDPKAGPHPKNDNETGDTLLQIKKTATGHPGDIIAINPKMKMRKGAPDSGVDSEHKSKPAV